MRFLDRILRKSVISGNNIMYREFSGSIDKLMNK